jgi:excisionase family DNA binding protein
MSIKPERLTVAEFCKEWKVARSTFYVWLAKGEAPAVIKLPNGQLRINRRDIEKWEALHTVDGVAA